MNDWSHDANAIPADERAGEILAELVFSKPEVAGAVLASVDGRVIASDVPASLDDRQVAAMLASTFGLGQRLIDFVGTADLSEIVVKSDDGLVFVYAVGPRAALLILTKAGVNIGLLQLDARRTSANLVALLPHATP